MRGMERMRGLLLGLLACSLLALLDSCGSARKAARETERRDSTRVEVRTETAYVTDTVYVEIPPQAAERTTADSASHLENDYAASDARINADGALYHDLRTKPQERAVAFEKPVERRDSIVYRDVVTTERIEVEVEVERELTWWQQTQIYGFWALLIAALACITFTNRNRLAKWLANRLMP